VWHGLHAGWRWPVTSDVPPVARQHAAQAWYMAAALIPLPACSSPFAPCCRRLCRRCTRAWRATTRATARPRPTRPQAASSPTRTCELLKEVAETSAGVLHDPAPSAKAAALPTLLSLCDLCPTTPPAQSLPLTMRCPPAALCAVRAAQADAPRLLEGVCGDRAALPPPTCQDAREGQALKANPAPCCLCRQSHVPPAWLCYRSASRAEQPAPFSSPRMQVGYYSVQACRALFDYFTG